MAMNTVILINNNGLAEIEDHPKKFVDDIKMRMGMDSVKQKLWHGNFGNTVQVSGPIHSQDSEFYMVYGNALTTLNYWDIDQLIENDREDEAEELIKKMRERVETLEEDYLDILEKKKPLLGKAKRALKK